MSLETKIMTDLKEAMKAKDQAAIRSIRAIKAAILLAKTDGSGRVLDEAAEIKLVQKLVKQRQDSLEIYEKQSREDLAITEREEINILKNYLPEQMSEEKLQAFIEGLIGEVGASSMKDMGKVMGAVTGKTQGAADNKRVSEIVKAKLS